MPDRFIVEETSNDESRVVIDSMTGEEIGYLTHDELGWSGMDFVEDLIARINKAMLNDF